MDVKPAQLRKAAYPILVTLSGMVTNVKSVYPSKAALPILVTAPPSYSEGITTVERVPLYLAISHSLLPSDANVNSLIGVSLAAPQTHIPVAPKSCAAISVLLLQRAHTFQCFSESEIHSTLLVSCPSASIASLSVLPHTSHSRVRSPFSVHVAGVVSSHSPHVCASSHIAYSVMLALTVSVRTFHICSPAVSSAKPTSREHCLVGRVNSPMTCPFSTIMSASALPPCVSNVTMKLTVSSPGSSPPGLSPGVSVPGSSPPGVCCPEVPLSLQAARMPTARTRQHASAMMKNNFLFMPTSQGRKTALVYFIPAPVFGVLNA